MVNFDFLKKGLGIVSPSHFVYDFSKKCFMLCACLIAFTSSDIGQYVYSNCLLTSLWRHKFKINLIFLINFQHDQKFKIKFKYLEKERSF